ncbi:unnamed protein product, partial [Timema podura]|nr:unnamed protein product [Timema podura]
MKIHMRRDEQIFHGLLDYLVSHDEVKVPGPRTSAAQLSSLVCELPTGWGQENALQRIPDSLIECYNTSTGLNNKENLLPMNLQTLLSILRKVEDSEEGRNLNLLSLSTSILHSSSDIRQMAFQLTLKNHLYHPFPADKDMAGRKWLRNVLKWHPNLSLRKLESVSLGKYEDGEIEVRISVGFKLDGIERNPKVLETSGVIPYSVSGIQFYKHKILLTKLIPQNNYKFPNETLTPIERCTLHLMLSKSIEKYQRGDEGTTCNKLSSSSLVSPFFRRKRQVEVESESGSGSGGLVGPTTSTGDSEVHDETRTSLTATEEYPGKEIDSEDVEEDVNSDNDDSSVLEIPDVVNRQTTTSVLSDCPVENGVIHTKWGAVSISSVIAGIVSGLETQTVSLENLVFENDRANSLQEAIAAAAQGVDNRWSATIS